MSFFETHYLYIYLLLFSMAYPLAQSFEQRLKYFKKWKGLFLGTIIMMLLFIPWDIYFTAKNWWWFNETYTLGFSIAYLPIEEWLFFIIVPFACMFIFEVVGYFFSTHFFQKITHRFNLFLSVILMFTAVFHWSLPYTFVTFSLTSIALVIAYFKKPIWMGQFWLSYLICLIPFFLVNSVLTGLVTKSPVVNYHPTAFMGIRLGTIPLEDSMYNLLMLLIVTSVYQSFNTKHKKLRSKDLRSFKIIQN